ncbi:MAG TPA: dihydrofolate reductase family protein [Allosphingosinicella sp.]|nr:dihydrofolate reductase family protein [Allosphingosinicella sp.]
MNVIAYFTLSADGFLPRAEDKDLPPPDPVINDSLKRAAEAGSLIVGRTTYESMEGEDQPVPVAIVSTSMKAEGDGVFVADSPAKAVRLLERKGISGALVGGGAKLFSSFLAAGLVDELYVNIAPELIGRGLRIEGPRRRAETLKLVRTTRLDEGIVQLHYRR